MRVVDFSLEGTIEFSLPEYLQTVLTSVLALYFHDLDYGEHYISFKGKRLACRTNKDYSLDVLSFLNEYAAIHSCHIVYRASLSARRQSLSGLIYHQNGKLAFDQLRKSKDARVLVEDVSEFFEELEQKEIKNGMYYKEETSSFLTQGVQWAMIPLLRVAMKNTKKHFPLIRWLTRYFWIEIEGNKKDYMLAEGSLFRYETHEEQFSFSDAFAQATFLTKPTFDEHETRKVHLQFDNLEVYTTLSEPIMDPLIMPIGKPVIELENGDRVDICSQCVNRTRKLYQTSRCQPCLPKLRPDKKT